MNSLLSHFNNAIQNLRAKVCFELEVTGKVNINYLTNMKKDEGSVQLTKLHWSQEAEDKYQQVIINRVTYELLLFLCF